MNLLLGIICRNEQAMLGLTLPVYAEAFEQRLALDTGSTDDTLGILRQHGFTYGEFQWRNDYSAARNALYEMANKFGSKGDWILMLDADEAMNQEEIHILNELCEAVHDDVIALPRINLADAGRLYECGSYPDWQARCLRLHSNVKFDLPVHEVIREPQYRAEGLHIYHYGFCKPPRQNWLRSHNYRMISEHKELLREAPDWVSDDYREWLNGMSQRHKFVPFDKPHPLKGKL